MKKTAAKSEEMKNPVTQAVESSNYDRDEGSTIVLQEKQTLAQLREKSKLLESCILFFCKNCQAVVPAEKCGRRYSYICMNCGSKEVAFGTQASIAKFFHLTEAELTPIEVREESGSQAEPEVAQSVA